MRFEVSCLYARPDWLPSFYHRADSVGLGFDRSPSGSNATAQYPEPYASQYASIETCPEEYLLWFHHVPWTYRMPDGSTMWETLCRHYETGCRRAEAMKETWRRCEPDIADKELHADVLARLTTQARDARWWAEACMLYFQQFHGMPLPDFVARPKHTLEQLKQICLPIDNFTCPSPEMLDSLR